MLVHTCVYDLAFCVQVIKCMKGSLKYKGQDRGWQPSGWVAMQEVEHTLPQWRMHQTPMLAIRAIDLETVEQRSDSAAANVALGSCFYALIHIDFIVQLISHDLRVGEEFQGDMSAATGTYVVTC